MSSLRKKTTTAVLADAAGKYGAQLVALGATMYLARKLVPADFGLIAMSVAIVGIAAVFSDGGLTEALIQRRRLHRLHISSAWVFNIVMSVAMAIACFFSAEAIAGFFNNSALIRITQWMSGFFVLTALGATPTALLQKRLRHGELAIMRLIAAALSSAVAILFALRGFGALSLVAQQLTLAATLSLLASYAVRHELLGGISIKALRQLWSFGIKSFAIGLLNNVYLRLDYLVIGKLFPAAILGLFHRAKSLNHMLVVESSGTIRRVTLAALSQIQNRQEKFRQAALKIAGITSVFAAFLAGNLYVGGVDLFVLLFGDQWTDAGHYFQYLAIAGYAVPVSAVLLNFAYSRGNAGSVLRFSLLQKSLLTANLIVGISLGGIYGYLIGLIGVSAISLLIAVSVACRSIAVQPATLLRPIVSSAGLAIGSAFVASAVPLSGSRALDLIILCGSYTAALATLFHLTRLKGWSDALEELSFAVRKTEVIK